MRLWPREIAATTATEVRSLIARLEVAVRHERRRGLSRGWAYDLNRHRALIDALAAERLALAALTGPKPGT